MIFNDFQYQLSIVCNCWLASINFLKRNGSDVSSTRRSLLLILQTKRITSTGDIQVSLPPSALGVSPCRATCIELIPTCNTRPLSRNPSSRGNVSRRHLACHILLGSVNSSSSGRLLASSRMRQLWQDQSMVWRARCGCTWAGLVAPSSAGWVEPVFLEEYYNKFQAIRSLRKIVQCIE